VRRIVPIPLTVGLTSLLTVPLAHAECVIPGPWSLRDALVELVFSGDAASIGAVGDGGIRVRFNLDPVWKVPVTEDHPPGA
jgi:hypothetical protein